MDNDGFVSNGELFQVLKMMVGNNLKDTQLQQIVDKTIILYDKVSLSQIYDDVDRLTTIQFNSTKFFIKLLFFQDNDGKISFDEFCQVVKNTDIHTRMVVEVQNVSLSSIMFVLQSLQILHFKWIQSLKNNLENNHDDYVLTVPNS